MKKLVFLTIGIMLIVSTLTVCLAREFPDVEANHWAYKYIDELSNKGIINGYDDGTYKPNGTVKRSEFVKLIITSVLPRGINEDELMSNFEHWAAKYVWFAEQRGVLDEGEYNKSNIDEPITRLEMVRLISKADIYIRETTSNLAMPEQDFLDILEISDEDYGFLCHAVNNGLIKGYEDYTFKPEKTMTRAEAATMIWRFNGGKDVSK